MRACCRPMLMADRPSASGRALGIDERGGRGRSCPPAKSRTGLWAFPLALATKCGGHRDVRLFEPGRTFKANALGEMEETPLGGTIHLLGRSQHPKPMPTKQRCMSRSGRPTATVRCLWCLRMPLR